MARIGSRFNPRNQLALGAGLSTELARGSIDERTVPELYYQGSNPNLCCLGVERSDGSGPELIGLKNSPEQTTILVQFLARNF